MKKERRDFIKKLLLGSGGLVLGFKTFDSNASEATIENNTEKEVFNAFLKLSNDGTVIIYSPNPEIGQGIKTAFAIIVAEELDIDWETVTVEQADLDTKRFERQLTGGSGAIKHSWERLRKAGATARYLLVEAAAAKLKVNASTLRTEKGFVISASNEKIAYKDLVDAAATIEIPKDIKLKSNGDFKLIGKSIKSVDNYSVLTGKPVFGIDYHEEGMLYAQIVRAPGFGQKLKGFDATRAKKIEGIKDVISFGNKVAIVGTGNWPIIKARKTLKIDWVSDKVLESTELHNEIFTKLMSSKDSEVRRKDGDFDSVYENAYKKVESTFQCPFLPHNTMEPMNFFADVKETSARIIGPTQTPQSAQNQVAKLLSIPVENVTVGLTKMGGGFGRRLNNDYALEAAELSSIIKAPVKLQWTREDDMTGGIYRPAVRYRFRAALNEKGEMTAFSLKGVGLNAGNSTRQDNFPVGAVENVLIESADYKSDITTGPWRAPITNFLAYAEQAFLDEVAYEAKKDPIQFRLELLKKAISNPVGKLTYEPKRFEEVIKTVATRANWAKPKKGFSQGFSVYFSHNSYVAQVAEMELKKGKPSLKKVFAVTDCGIVINQSGARNQIYGAILDGIGHAMFGNLTFKDGAAQESNFDKYRLLKHDELPEIDAFFVDNGIDPTGLGEPALPPTGGAIANAIFKVTGKRLYNQPFILENKEIEEIL